jgi:predicted HAD superfamily phosphohydrolase YqeG
MKENILRFTFTQELPKKVLEEIILNFDETHSPINQNELTKKPSEFAYKTTQMTFITGLNNSTQNQAEVIRYPLEIDYLEVKGPTTRKIIEDALNKYKINYQSNLQEI